MSPGPRPGLSSYGEGKLIGPNPFSRKPVAHGSKNAHLKPHASFR
jgi:hypothetical protein